MSDLIPFDELLAAHHSELRQLAQRRDAELERAAKINADALDGYRSVSEDANARHARELEERRPAFAKHAAVELAPVVGEWCEEPNRANTSKVQAAFAALDAEKRRRLGEPLQDELMWAVARIYAERDPSSLPRLANLVNFYNAASDSGARKASHILNGIMRRGNGDTASQLHALEALERELSAIAAPGGGQAQDHEPAARFELLASGLLPEEIQRQLIALDKAAHIAKHGSPEQIQARASAYEEALGKGIRPSRIAAFITDKLAGVVQQVVNTVTAVTNDNAEQAPPAKRPKGSAASQSRSLAEVRADQAELAKQMQLQIDSMPNSQPAAPASFI